jgi:hypothetical protein
MQPIGKPGSNSLTTKPMRLHVHVDNETKHATTTSTRRKSSFKPQLLGSVTITATNKKHTYHMEQKNNDLRKLRIESSIQENGIMEFGLNFPIALKALPKKLVIVKNISSKKSSRVSVCGIEELKSNVMQKPRVDLIQYPTTHAWVSKRTHKLERCLELHHHLRAHETPNIRDGQKRCIESKHPKSMGIEGERGTNHRCQRSFAKEPL